MFLLTVLQRVFTGPVGEGIDELPDLSGNEIATLLPLLILVFWVGIAPAGWLALSEVATGSLANLFR